MLKSNLHTHTHYSDGSHPPEEYILEAIRLGFCCIGFSDHSPLPFENSFALREEKTGEYFEVIRALKNKYRGRIDVMLGISCALLGIFVFEKGLMKWGAFGRFFERYSRYIK